MKFGLFILSILGFGAAAIEILNQLSGDYSDGHIIYLFLLIVLMCNCIVGTLMTYPQLSNKRKMKGM